MSVLDVELAQKFIEKIVKNLHFNVNVMNEKGIIIASKDKGRVGDFHEVAFNLLNGKMTNGIVKKIDEGKFINTKAGINMFIEYEREKVGVICVSGNPAEVEVFAELVKTSMETMLEYEFYRENQRRKKTDIDKFMHYLLFEENMEMHIAKKMADEIYFKEDLHRVVMIVHNGTMLDNAVVIEQLQKAKGASKVDLITVVRNDNIVLLKYVEDAQGNVLTHFRDDIKAYYEHVMQLLPEKVEQDKITFFVGTLQKNIERYRGSYMNAYFLYSQLKYRQGIYFFNDCLMDYLRSMLTMKAYDNIFSVYKEFFSQSDQIMIYETVDALNNNNYNLVNSAKELFIHRNTMVFRINKIREILKIDPLVNGRDKEFLNELAFYLKNNP